MPRRRIYSTSTAHCAVGLAIRNRRSSGCIGCSEKATVEKATVEKGDGRGYDGRPSLHLPSLHLPSSVNGYLLHHSMHEVRHSIFHVGHIAIQQIIARLQRNRQPGDFSFGWTRDSARRLGGRRAAHAIGHPLLPVGEGLPRLETLDGQLMQLGSAVLYANRVRAGAEWC